jgi:hypothetical protein
MAFQVSHSTEKRKVKVIFSLKNEVKTSLMDLSRTLHPATQYLNNYPRKMLLHEISPWRVTCMTSSVPHLEDHFNFFVNESFEDTTSWIRVGLTAVSIDDKSAEISKNLCDNDDLFLLGSLNSKSWLTGEIRRKHVTVTSLHLNCDAAEKNVQMRSVRSLSLRKPNGFQFDIVPNNLQKRVKEYREYDGVKITEKEMVEEGLDPQSAQTLYNLLEIERSNQAQFSAFLTNNNL